MKLDPDDPGKAAIFVVAGIMIVLALSTVGLLFVSLSQLS